MKRFLLIIFLLLILFTAKSQIKWDSGGADNQWNTPANWVGDAVPGPADNVLLDNSVVLTSYTVNLPGGAVSVSVNSLTITPSGANTITLINPVTNTSPTAFTATGAGDAVILNNGAVFKNSSGASSGTPVSVISTNFFRINNGGRYIHNCDCGHANYLVAQLSTAAGTENGTFEFDVPAASYFISFSNRTFGNLEFSSVANGTPVTYIAGGSQTPTVNGNLIINAGTTFSLDFSGDVIIKGDLDQSATSTFNISNGGSSDQVKIGGNINVSGTITESGTVFPSIVLNGTSPQTVSISTLTNSVTFSINNSTGATLASPLTLPYNLQFTSGKIKTDAVNILTMLPAGSSTGASPASFVEGPVNRIGNSSFIFPIGAGSIFAPLTISGSGGPITDAFTAEYKRINPQSIHGAAVQSGLNHVSYVEYWKLAQTVGTTSVKVSLKVNTTSFCFQLANTFVSRWNGALWTNEASTISGFGTSGPYQIGTLTTNSTLSGFGDFTLATDLAFAANPLPLNLISFDAIKLNSGTALLKWELASFSSDATKFEVEKSTDNRTFTAFDKVSGNQTDRFYSLYDNRLGKGITYYRLKMIDDNGKISYSRIAAIINDEAGLLITSLWPDPVQQNATLTVSAAKAGKVNIVISDLSGKAVKQWYTNITGGNNNITINADGLTPGIYYVIVSGSNNKVVSRFVKQ